VADLKGEPIVLSSPTGKESFDSIETIENVDVLYKKTPTGFTAVATVPLSVLGWQPRPNTMVKMDVGCIFGNQPGNQAALRSYWINNSFSANVTYDIPNESRLEPAEWGTAAIE